MGFIYGLILDDYRGYKGGYWELGLWLMFTVADVGVVVGGVVIKAAVTGAVAVAAAVTAVAAAAAAAGCGSEEG